MPDGVDVQRIDPNDGQAFAAWYSILRRTDQERWGDIPGWDERFVKMMALDEGGAEEFHLLAATTPSGDTVGMAGVMVPQLDNLTSVGFDIRVDPDRRRERIGTALAAAVERHARTFDRTVLNCNVEIPTELVATSPAEPFAHAMGFTPIQYANRRHLILPIEPERLTALREEVERHTTGYRILTFTSPWPEEFIEDECELNRRMSTDEPTNDTTDREQMWDSDRVAKAETLRAAQGVRKLIAAAQHIESGRLVAYTQLVVADVRPDDAWQWATIVLKEHRGHRLGLAVKLANIEYMAQVFPSAWRISTGNAQENAPMISVNDRMGFEVVATDTFWQKTLES
jgi:GNAT superfamily N-acetyltransferase